MKAFVKQGELVPPRPTRRCIVIVEHVTTFEAAVCAACWDRQMLEHCFENLDLISDSKRLGALFQLIL
jgi:hypothetical protein